jgi:uncharacterized OB-fold protein
MTEWWNEVQPLTLKGQIAVPYTWWAGETGSRFLAALRDSRRILGTKCGECGTVYVPPRRNCGRCFVDIAEWVDIADEGVIQCFTIVHYAHSSNTSTLSISSIASATKNPERVIGTHFFSPVPLMRLVEVIRGEKTGEAAVRSALEFCKAIGKTPILAKDVPGFIVNRFLCLLYNEAADQIYKGYATPRDIDLGLKLGANHPMGPVEIMDMAGVDVVNNALIALYEMTGEERYRPSPLFEQMIRGNRLGRKTGRGFYDYKRD